MTSNGNKPIAIIGGGISALATLHFLKQRFGNDRPIHLYEKKEKCGGNIETDIQEGFLCEYGPNAFLNNKPLTLDFIDSLGLTPQLIRANPIAKKRFISIHSHLIEIPTDPLKVLTFKPFSWMDKWQMLNEIVRPKFDNSQESVAEFFRRRFGNKALNYFVDPFVSGIFAGDVNRLHMASAFPSVIAHENEHGSLIKALWKNKKSPATMLSFKKGMGELIVGLTDKYREHISTGATIDLKQLKDHHIVFTTPAYVTAKLIKDIDPVLAEALDKIVYAPVIVIGLGFKKIITKKIPAFAGMTECFAGMTKVTNVLPEGFGYLNPSLEKKKVLGVLFESNIFEGRAPQQGIMLRLMLGGRHNPDILDLNQEELLNIAISEIRKVLNIQDKPDLFWVKRWPLAIPQYEMDYPHIINTIQSLSAKHPLWKLSGNYINGISFNDCIAQAKSISLSL